MKSDSSNFIHAREGLELFPPFHALSIKLLKLDSNWQQITLLLPLSDQTANPGGSMFGGAIASLADPIPALACANLFPDYLVWTRKLEIDFRQEARTDLELRFSIPTLREQSIRETLAKNGRCTPEFEYGFYNQKNEICAWVKNLVAIRQPAESNSGGALGKPTKA